MSKIKRIIEIEESALERIKDILVIDKKYSLLPDTTNGIAYEAIAQSIPYDEAEVWRKSNELLEKRLTYLGRPQGKWGKWVISEIRCPNCLEYFDTDCYSAEELKKCPNCGVDMRGDTE